MSPTFVKELGFFCVALLYAFFIAKQNRECKRVRRNRQCHRYCSWVHTFVLQKINHLMRNNILNNIITAILFSTLNLFANAQTVHELRVDSNWIKPFEPFRIAGNFYYVGTYDLGCYLITTSNGNILINTGLASSATQIKKNVETLGFKFSDIKILLTTQAHYDHVGAMAEIKKETGAIFIADAADAESLKTGGSSDYEMGKYGVTFKPVEPDKLLHDRDTIRLGEMTLIMLHHPGHTKGSCSYLFNVKDEQKNYHVLIANLPSIITDRRFADIKSYPTIAADYAYTLDAMQHLNFDIWVASHASQFNLHDKHKPGDAYNPLVFADRKGYEDALNDLKEVYEEKIKKETQQ